MLQIAVALANVAADAVVVPDEIVITSGIDGVHQPNSLHYALRALDVRTKTFPTPSSRHAFIEQVRAELGPDFQVILENPGEQNEHLHIEYDP
jgi:hypothetical protein